MTFLCSSLLIISLTILAVGFPVSAHLLPSHYANNEAEKTVLRFFPEARPNSQDTTSSHGQYKTPGSNHNKRKLLSIVSEAIGDPSSQRPRFHGFWKVVSCELCKIGASILQEMLAKNASHDDIMSTAVKVCVEFKIESERVCSGLASIFTPEIFTVLDSLVLSPDEICGIFLDSCGSPYDPYNDWNVTLPNVPQPAPVDPRPPKPGSPTFRFLHLTDVHIDLEYKAGSVAECDEPLCCREGNGSSNGAWKFGDYRNCDTPPWTLENMLAHLANQSDSFDYIIWTGDIPGHNIWNQTREDQLKVIAYASNLLLKYFPGKPVYPSLGNHESSPVNSFPPSYIKGANSMAWLYDALADHWSHWLPKDTIQTVKLGAYYSVSPFPGFRIISLNMNYCNDQNWWMLLNTTDPNGELHWLVNTLQEAENKNEKVHILGHIPPGIVDCLKGWSWNFYKIVSRYQNTIAGQFYGHTHYDSFAVFYDVETLKRPVSIAYVGPSTTPYSQLNIGYRFYTMDGHYNGSSYHVLDHETNILNLTRAHQEGKITWEFEYSAKATYGLTNLFPSDWDHLINVMKTNQTLMNAYNKYYRKSRYNGACDATCRHSLLCEARSGRSYDDKTFCKDL